MCVYMCVGTCGGQCVYMCIGTRGVKGEYPPQLFSCSFVQVGAH